MQIFKGEEIANKKKGGGEENGNAPIEGRPETVKRENQNKDDNVS